MTPLQHLIQEREAAFDEKWPPEHDYHGVFPEMKDLLRETALLAYKAGLEAARGLIENEEAPYIRTGDYSEHREYGRWEQNQETLKNIDQALSAIEKSV